MDALLKIEDLTVRYDDKVVLDKVGLEVSENDFIGITGPNGGGKTTLIKAIIGLVSYEGRIIYGEKLRQDSGAIGYLPQINNFDRAFPISVRDVVMSGLQCGGTLKRRFTPEESAKAEALMLETGVDGYKRKAIGELSGGQIQRALLCRALISDPKLLILDEPTNFVDSKFETELYAILKRLNERMAIIMVSHDIGDIKRHVKRIVCVNRTVHCHQADEFSALFL